MIVDNNIVPFGTLREPNSFSGVNKQKFDVEFVFIEGQYLHDRINRFPIGMVAAHVFIMRRFVSIDRDDDSLDFAQGFLGKLRQGATVRINDNVFRMIVTK